MLAIRLPEEIETRLTALAKRTGRTKTFYAREAILKYLEDLEDLYDTEEALREFRSSGEKALTWAEVKKNLDL